MKRLLLIFALLSATLAQAAVEVAGVKFDDKARLGNTELALNGAGLRSRFIIKVYAVGLYLPQKAASVAEALALKGPARLHVVALRELPAEDFANALVEGIHRNHTDAENEQMKPRVEEFKGIILAQKPATKGTVLTLDWLPESGTRLSIDGKAQGQDIAGDDFYRALLKIWLGAKPAQDDLKYALLGQGR